MTSDLVSVSEAARRTGIPRRTIRRWIYEEQLFACGIDPAGVLLYDLAAVRDRAATTQRPRPATRRRKPGS